MITDAEVRREARRARVEPRVIELDHALGWALWGLARSPRLARSLVFKGGTCLRKCFIEGYRFSEDLDFTARTWAGWEEIDADIRAGLAIAGRESGLDFAAEPMRFEVVNNEYGKESLAVRVYWRGSHSLRGSARSLRLDISRGEVLAFEPEPRRVMHPYSDAGELGELTWECYTLEEVLCEKLRAVLGQRRHAVSRDLFDIHSLRDLDVDEARVLAALPAKLEAKALGIDTVSAERLITRKEEFEADWNRNLVHLVPAETLAPFEEIWNHAYELVRRFVP